MNVITGGTHVVLFERDQQLTSLLLSELQLAGFECHPARTAVEVFDAIARYPVRLALVNLAQAATARREFWVALDTQRRGRGIQVFTFRCSNIAGYGPTLEEVEDRNHTAMADMEVDGMLGVINMVNTIRTRFSAANTGAMPRQSLAQARGVGGNGSASTPAPTLAAQVTVPMPSMKADSGAPATLAARQAHIPREQAQIPQTPLPDYTGNLSAATFPYRQAESTDLAGYQENNTTQPHLASRPHAGSPLPSPSPQSAVAGSMQAQAAGMVTGMPRESSLAQLSRMLQEHRAVLGQETEHAGNAHVSEDTLLQPRVRPGEATTIGAIPLRASPIQDLPESRPAAAEQYITEASPLHAARNLDEAGQADASYTPSPATLASIAMNGPLAPPALVKPQPVPPASFEDTQRLSAITPTAPGRAAPAPLSAAASGIEPHHAVEPGIKDQSTMQRGVANQSASATGQRPVQENAATVSAQTLSNTGPLKAHIYESAPNISPALTASSTPRQQALQGRASRPLSNVLLEGHIVPQNRLEVAQNIQRMLRGVDLSYQLGDILLMFKLLTPDQLLAANLVSHGLISTVQISALGRIRQELHSIGLEYDLENLLVIFRILMPEQIREARAGGPA